MQLKGTTVRTTTRIVIYIFSLLISFSSNAIETPVSLEGAVMVEAKEAKLALDADKSIAVIDVRSKLEYAEERIPGAICVTYKERSKKEIPYDESLDQFDMSKLPQNKNVPVMIYCNGSDCWKSYKASAAAVKAGYKKVYWYRTGMPDWMAQHYPVEQ